MFTLFDTPEDSRELYFKLSSSFQISSRHFNKSFKFSGIYAIYRNDNCYYVGQSQNLASRISQHLSGKYKSCDKIEIFMPNTNGFSDFFSRSKETRKIILEKNEMLLMSILKPIENLITPPSDFELNEDSAFHCFITDDEDYKLEPDLIIGVDSYSISVSPYREIELHGVRAVNSHNEFVIETVEKMGGEFARDEFCYE